ncbi:MAG: hypothetical protein ICCCNLDF_02198 [Planctomycetes bacterium]|nr:hypothetical protein [Planctomycetota bacterium]
MARWTLFIAALLAMPLCAQQQPTEAEMAFIYELNRARSDPQRYDTENSLGGILAGVAAQPPLALNLNLVQSARFHSAEMAANGYFAHQSAVTGDWPNKMARDAGYPLVTAWTDNANYIESLAARYSSAGSVSYSAPEALKALIIDAGINPPGHRIHLLGMDSFSAAFREVGTGYAQGIGVGWPSGAYWSIHTGRRNTDPVWLTGVVYSDTNGNGRYDQGEGLSGVTVTATGAVTRNTTSTVGGGWSIDVTAGTWNLSCSGGTFVGTATASVNVTTANVAVDFESGTTQGEVNFGSQVVTPPPGGSSSSSDDGGGGGCAAEGGAHPAWWLLFAGLFGLGGLLRKRKAEANSACAGTRGG